MRLKCEVQVINRLLPTLNLRKPPRTTYTYVSIGRKPGDQNKCGQVYLMLCTAQNRNGDKYLLNHNVEQIFGKFINEGKATVRLRNPADDIFFSKADRKQLAMFIKLVKLACDGKDFPAHSMSTLAPVSSEQIVKPVLSMDICKPSEYPILFRRTLLRLTITNCSLTRISPQIQNLPELGFLDMSFNSLSVLPSSFGQLSHLHTLRLCHNKLIAFPEVLYSSNIRKVLVTLDLRNNEIPSIPGDVMLLESLQEIHLCYNRIKRFPESMAFMKVISKIHMSNNLLDMLPGWMLTRRFDTVDFSNNPFSGQLKQRKKVSVPSLLELSARKVISHRIPYTREDLDWVSIRYIKTAHFCLCGKPCFESRISQLVNGKVPTRTCYDNRELPFLVNFCSKTCSSRFL